MFESKRLAPPNSVVLVSDPRDGEIPTSMNQSLISATASCIAIGCKAEDDGETEIRLGNVDKITCDEKPAFIGQLKTPSRKIVVRTVYHDTLLEMAVPTAETPVWIWVNDSQEPDVITIGFA